MARWIITAVSVLLVSGMCLGAEASDNPMLHASNDAVVDGSSSPVLLKCVNLSPWLFPEVYLSGKASLRGLTTSPSEFKQHFVELMGAQKGGSVLAGH